METIFLDYVVCPSDKLKYEYRGIADLKTNLTVMFAVSAYEF